MPSPVARLNEFGQSPWLDYLRRDLVQRGELATMVEEDGLRGLTSNPTIFEKAVAAGEEYDEALGAASAGPGRPIEEIGWDLVLADVAAAADVFRPTFEALGGRDGLVSVEVSPELAHDSAGTLAQLRRLADRLDRPNILVKVPATAEGLAVIEAAVAEGRSVNVTLVFSLSRHREVMEAYLRGLERLTEGGGDPSRVASVASFFVSRVDTEADRRLPEGHFLRGKVAVANAKLAYRSFRRCFSGERWERLAALGARVQRPLWASTSTKNPDYPDTIYVDQLVGRDTVNTLAPATIQALREHGNPRGDTVEEDPEGAEAALAALADAGVDYDDVTATLEREGVASFAASYRHFLEALAKRVGELAP